MKQEYKIKEVFDENAKNNTRKITRNIYKLFNRES